VEMVNDLRRQGVEVQTANEAGTLGGVSVAAGDYIIRADQPYRTLVDLYFSLQNYPVSNPLPYDDTGWTMPLQRNVTVKEVKDKKIFDTPMTMLTADADPKGIVQGSGPVLVVVNNTDNVLTTFRFQNTSACGACGRIRDSRWRQCAGAGVDCEAGADCVCDHGADGEDASADGAADWLCA